MSPKRSRPCKLCSSKRFHALSLCFKHYHERKRLKKEETKKRRLDRKLKSKTFTKSQTKLWHAKAWKLMSEWVRRQGVNFQGYNTCYTCWISFPWKELHAGHYQHGKLDFDERNLKPQCVACNTYRGGQLDTYTLRLIHENGLEWVNQLKRDAAVHPGYSLEELKRIYLELTERLNRLN